MKNLTVKAEPQRLDYALLKEMYPEKTEMIDGNLLGAEAILLCALYNVGLTRMLELLPAESLDTLKTILKEERKEERGVRKANQPPLRPAPSTNNQSRRMTVSEDCYMHPIHEANKKALKMLDRML